MKAKKRTFKVGDSVKFISRVKKNPRFEVSGKVARLFQKVIKGKKTPYAEITVSRGTKWNRLSKRTSVLIMVSKLF